MVWKSAQQLPVASFAHAELSHVCVLVLHAIPWPQFASVTHPTHVFDDVSQNIGVPPSGAQLASL
jgi:hypothetical protein